MRIEAKKSLKIPFLNFYEEGTFTNFTYERKIIMISKQ